MFRYQKGVNEPPPNAKYRIIKPIFEKNIEKLTVMQESGKSFVFHSSIKSDNFVNDVNYFVSVIEKIVFTNVLENIFESEPEFRSYADEQLKDFQNGNFLMSNTYVIDRRINR